MLNDANLYPTPANGTVGNPDACWDPVGFCGWAYAQESGAQVSAIKAMVDRLSSASQ